MPEPVRSYLASPGLAPLWAAVRARLEQRALTVGGSVTVELGEEGARRLAGLLGNAVPPGRVRVPLRALDEALRSSRAQCGLITVVADLTGGALTDRRAVRAGRHTAWALVWTRFEEVLEDAGLASRPWAALWREDIRSSGLLARAGPEIALGALEGAVRAVACLAVRLNGPDPPAGPLVSVEIAELAARTTGDAHGLDDGHLAGGLVLRAIAAATGQALPADAGGRRRLWEAAGVSPDEVSGTVLTLGLRPAGGDPWPVMLRARADLNLPTHLTWAELRSPVAATALAQPGEPVHACENPQLLQAAARHGIPGALVCTSGNPSHAGWQLLERLQGDGARILYHGDFDWPGIAIASRVISGGAHPWRMSGDDYLWALSHSPGTARLPLHGDAVATEWDASLEARMREYGIAVHEEALLSVLLNDLRDGSRG
ncbi:TIGR02679 family protein [Streptomyces sp. MMS21 TC-5]|uniref:TIGR02679 family protein n=1 Tax=Streptomyces sp. MMS21 TC-5 TaxID=2925833 RepID=UPI001F625FD0|nr:TIGR02679 family protein [Streptomyces sp. MMS21 TC-5]MCI4078770.1 TIGR02679 family protein [Streptomyces sp. MMS21 TC-5]